jgi:hypothetical protein
MGLHKSEDCSDGVMDRVYTTRIEKYDVKEIEREIDALAAENYGEVPEYKMQELVESKTQSIQALEKMLQYVAHLGHFITTSALEEKRIYALRKKAESTKGTVKKYLAPYFNKNGKMDVGTFNVRPLTTNSILIDNVDMIPSEFMVEKVTRQPDKAAIRNVLESGGTVDGAMLVENTTVIIR